MSTVFLHVGQCGNQVGHSFWKRTGKDEDVKKSHTFIAGDGKYRSVLVDSEPKVIQRVTRGLQFREESIVTGKRGRGTNWTLGYHGLKSAGDDHLLDNTLNVTRKEIERCDCFSGLIVMHSLSGGTGSGLGSRLCESLRDEYPMSQLMSCAFAPCLSGESPLQNYNSLLTLAWLQRYTDSIVLTHNDDVISRVQRKKGSESVSFANINEHIASSLCSVFLPSDSLQPNSGFSIGMEPWEMVRSVCPMPATKFVQLNYLARSKLSWEALMGQLLLTVKKYDQKGKPFSSISNVVIARGDSTSTFSTAMRTLEAKVKSAYHCVDWNPYPLDVWTAKSNSSGPKNAASLTVASNHSSITDYLDLVYQRSKVMYDAGAYLHWYWRHGACKDDFQEAFETILTVKNDYIEATKP